MAILETTSLAKPIKRAFVLSGLDDFTLLNSLKTLGFRQTPDILGDMATAFMFAIGCVIMPFVPFGLFMEKLFRTRINHVLKKKGFDIAYIKDFDIRETKSFELPISNPSQNDMNIVLYSGHGWATADRYADMLAKIKTIPGKKILAFDLCQGNALIEAMQASGGSDDLILVTSSDKRNRINLTKWLFQRDILKAIKSDGPFCSEFYRIDNKPTRFISLKRCVGYEPRILPGKNMQLAKL